MKELQVTEHALVFPCQGESLVGVLHLPTVPLETSIVIVVGGPQYRIGSHRQFVSLARAMAAQGHAVLRFDVRGMGDSTGASRSFEQITRDIAAAVDEISQRVPLARRIVLWGLCDGASAALLYLHEVRDARVRGLCLLNPWVRSDESLARTHLRHYYLRRLAQRDFWAKLLRGRITSAAVAELARKVRDASRSVRSSSGPSAPFQRRMAQAWREFSGSVLLLLSADDYTAKEFAEQVQADPAWKGVLQRSGVSVRWVDANHTFSEPAARAALHEHTLAWLRATC